MIFTGVKWIKQCILKIRTLFEVKMNNLHIDKSLKSHKVDSKTIHQKHIDNMISDI